MERKTREINNDFYETLNEQWLFAHDHPVALLRAENYLRTPWILKTISDHFPKKISLLDIGCGAGLFANPAAQEGYNVTGIDLSPSSLSVAKSADSTRSVRYLQASAESLPFENESFHVAIALDLLEHVQHPDKVISEASRVLKPGGLFFFHTFNRNFLSWLVVIKGVEWCVKGTPKNMHVYSLFLTPEEVSILCRRNSLEVSFIQGIRPDFLTKTFWQMLLTRRVPPKFSFTFTPSLKTGYLGFANKK